MSDETQAAPSRDSDTAPTRPIPASVQVTEGQAQARLSSAGFSLKRGAWRR
jgi:hypothetical protein